MDYQNQWVQLLNSSGSSAQTYGSYGSRVGELNKAFDLAVDGTGIIYVADTGNGRVQLFGAENGTLGDGVLSHPVAVKDYSKGLFVLDGSTVHRFDNQGQYLYSGSLDATGQYTDLAVDEAGLIYAINNATRAIDVYQPDFTKKSSLNGPLGQWNPAAICYSGGR